MIGELHIYLITMVICFVIYFSCQKKVVTFLLRLTFFYCDKQVQSVHIKAFNFNVQVRLYLGLAVMCGFVLYDTQLIVEKRRRGEEDYIA